MILRPNISMRLRALPVWLLQVCPSMFFLIAGAASAQERVLDHVIAVVNNQVILASDLEMELRFLRLLPIGDHTELTQSNALERLTTRALIEQQVLQGDPHGLEIAPKELEASLADLQQSLPECKHRDCKTEEGWRAYLATLGLTPHRVAEYWAHRMAVLRFIEERFRSGIRISTDEIQKYYQGTLVPKYRSAAEAPPLEQISPRIQEVLLQQQVNSLLDDWLKSLQDQGQVEILDPALRPPVLPVVDPSSETPEPPVLPILPPAGEARPSTSHPATPQSGTANAPEPPKGGGS
jgi:peptidyl-prolyl cis-trans isomerase SurA